MIGDRCFSAFPSSSWGGRAQWRSNDALSRAGTVEFISWSHREQHPRSRHNGGRYYDRGGEYHLQDSEWGQRERGIYLPSCHEEETKRPAKRNGRSRSLITCEIPLPDSSHVSDCAATCSTARPLWCADGLSLEWRKSEFLRCSWNTIMQDGRDLFSGDLNKILFKTLFFYLTS